LHWGDSRQSLNRLWPAAQAELDAEVAAGFPFLELDGVEFYFEGDGFDQLCEICIKVWAWAPGDASAYFDYGWLRKGLTNVQVQDALRAQGIAYRVELGPAFQTPNLRTATGVIFGFYSDFDIPAEAEIMNVYLGLPK